MSEGAPHQGSTARLRVAYLIHRLRLGGLETVAVELANGLAPDRFETSVISFATPDPRQNNLQTSRVRLVAFHKSDGNDPTVIYRLYRVLRELRPHIVQTHNWGTLLEGVVAARCAGVPIVVHAEHGTIQEGRWRLLTQRVLWRAVHKVLCVSQAHRQRLAAAVDFPADHLLPILNGVDTTTFMPRPADKETIRTEMGLEVDPLYIGTVGNLRPVKNQALLLQAVQQVCTRYNHVRVVIIGDGPLRVQLVGMAEALGIHKQVRFLGARSEIPELLNAMDIFVLPSLSEGLPMSVLEAMSCGLPVVATRVGGMPEVVVDGQTGLLVASEDTQQLARALETLVQQQDTRMTLGQQGRKRVVEYFSLHRMVRDYQTLYESLISGQRV
jgi:sugar transferase (PEP-CTERM/EpsH1 system associated)